MEKRIQEIIARCKAIDTEQAEIERVAELENDGKFTDEQRESYATLKTEFDTLLAEKKQLEDDAEMRAARAGRANDLQPRALPRKTPDNSGTPLPKAPEQEEPEDQRPKFRIPANVKRMAVRNFSGEFNGHSAEQRAFAFGNWLLAKLSRDMPHQFGHAFPAAVNFVNNYLGGIQNTAHGESDGVTGGQFLVPEEFSRDLIVLRERYGVVRSLFAIEPMGSDVRNIPKRASGLTASFVGESAAGTESNMTWSNIQLVAKKVMTVARMSNELSADAVISIGDQLAGEIAYAFANKEDECGLNGDGTSTYGGITGVRAALKTASGTQTTTSAGGIIIAAGNAYSEVTLANFNSVVGVLPAYADTPNASWVVHKTFYHSVMQRLEMAAGGVQANEIASGDRRGRPLFMGYPVTFSQVMPSAEANSQVCALLGDFRLGAVMGDRSMLSIMFSEHATIGGENVFEQDQIAIRGTERFDIVVHGVGNSTTAGPIVGLQLLNS